MVYFSDKQIAERYGVDRTTIWRWVKDGNFPEPVKLSKGCTRWPETPVLSWESRRAEGMKNA